MYYFAPQKGFASDGGLWLALLSPAALERVAEIARGWPGPTAAGSPSSCRCRSRSRTRSRTRPTTRRRSRRCCCWPTSSSGCSTTAAWTGWSRARPSPPRHLYGWAERHEHAEPFVADPAKRSLVVGTIDFDYEVDAADIAATLRANGIVDVEPYRKLGRNQLRVAMFPATDPSDVRALTACIDWVLEREAVSATESVSEAYGGRRGAPARAGGREDRRLGHRAAARALRRRARRRLVAR